MRVARDLITLWHALKVFMTCPKCYKKMQQDTIFDGSLQWFCMNPDCSEAWKWYWFNPDKRNSSTEQ